MAQKKKASRAKSKTSSTKKSESENVTRVRAVDTAPVAKKKNTPKPKETKVVKESIKVEEAVPIEKKKRKVNPKAALKPAKSLGGYFKGAWVELKQVRWPTRSATWEMTGAVLLYSAFFTVLILMLDAGFKYVFELILSK